MNKSLIIAAIFCVLLISCYTEIDLEKYKPAPKAVLNSVVTPDSIVMASISKTWFFTEKNTNVGLEDATVNLYINNEYKERMKWEITDEEQLNINGIYTSTIIPKPGDVIKIVADTKYGIIQAEDTVPAKTDIMNVKFTHTDYEYYGRINTDIKYEITFQDNKDQNDFYLIRISSTYLNSHTGIFDYSSDPIFIGHKSILEGSLDGKFLGGQGGRTFTDQTINGKQYTLIIKETDSQNIYKIGKTCKRKITLYTLSRAYYQYLTSLQYIEDDQLINDMANYGLSEPKRIFSNIQGGTGILGATHLASEIIDLRDIIPGNEYEY